MTISQKRGLMASATLAASLVLASNAMAQDSSGATTQDTHAGHKMDMPMTDDMSGMDMSSHSMTASLGSYGMSREASGTSWQPDASDHSGVMVMRGDWMLMGHAMLNAVYDRQDGPRGDDLGFVSGMVMGMAQRKLASGDTLQLRAMLSPDLAMGKRGYPLLLASGETADGVNGLVDRQHPHELFMELSASYSHPVSAANSVFIYGGLPGEPAFGPPAFMHRSSISDSPEAPISHHWLDSTHIVFGVVTAGVILGDWKVETSRFYGREPDQHRANIETGPLDSSSVRVSWNPTTNWSLQTSWADQKSPEQLNPNEDVRRLSASAIYAIRLASGGLWSSTAAWGRRTSDGEDLDAWALESSLKPTQAWTVFARTERTENNELTTVAGHHGPTYTVAKASLGVIRDWRVSEHITLGLGGIFAKNFLPKALEPAYGGDPSGMMAFVRLKIH